MASMTAQTGAEEASIQAVVIRCGCGNPASHIAEPCPSPRSTEDLGTVSYWHKNRAKRIWWALKHRGGS